jgi:hypothetical protein
MKYNRIFGQYPANAVFPPAHRLHHLTCSQNAQDNAVVGFLFKRTFIF